MTAFFQRFSVDTTSYSLYDVIEIVFRSLIDRYENISSITSGDNLSMWLQFSVICSILILIVLVC